MIMAQLILPPAGRGSRRDIDAGHDTCQFADLFSQQALQLVLIIEPFVYYFMLLHYDGDQTPSHRIRFVSFFLSSDSSCAYLEEKIYYLLLKIIAGPLQRGLFLAMSNTFTKEPPL
ncbi:hypothetical protein V2G26_020584 [Clonostachys chloroleuca]